jgi:hypothetical protein
MDEPTKNYSDDESGAAYLWKKINHIKKWGEYMLTKKPQLYLKKLIFLS